MYEIYSLIGRRIEDSSENQEFVKKKSVDSLEFKRVSSQFVF
jgi:hypothetical protein